MSRSASATPKGPAIQHLGPGVVLVQGLALVDMHRVFAAGLRSGVVRDGIAIPARLAYVQGVLATAAAEAAEDMADAADVRVSPVARQSVEPDRRIGTTEVAQMMDVTERHARRLGRTLGARKVHGRWSFDKATVVAYIAGCEAAA